MWRFTESGDEIEDVKGEGRGEEKKEGEEKVKEVKATEGEDVKPRNHGVKKYGAREDFVMYFTMSTPKGEAVRERVARKNE